MRRMSAVFFSFIAFASSNAHAATSIAIAYDSLSKSNGTSTPTHGTAGFILLDQNVYSYNEQKQLFKASLGQYMEFTKSNGIRYNVKYYLSANSIIQIATFIGHIVQTNISIRGDNCFVRVSYKPLPGKRQMFYPDGNSFTSTDIHNVTYTITTTAWQPPQ